mmetsp:Transcript_48513/g.105668  ORF Transcript_48513/g.105668 Transcript_48513/m.105668 type:complete len:532 (+) Transcript_48513:35-1630(+)
MRPPDPPGAIVEAPTVPDGFPSTLDVQRNAIAALVPVATTSSVGRQLPEQSNKPYCGALFVKPMVQAEVKKNKEDLAGVVAASDAGGGLLQLDPWVDRALADRLALVVAPASARSRPGPSSLRTAADSDAALQWGLMLLGVAETVLVFVCVARVKDPCDSVYNKLEAALCAFGDAVALVLLSLGIGSSLILTLGAWAMGVAHSAQVLALASARLVVSLPTMVVSVTVVMYGEASVVECFLCSVVGLLHLSLVFCGCAKRFRKSYWWALSLVGVLVVCGYFLAFVVDSVSPFGASDCPASSNQKMPVFLAELQQWQCVSWGSTSRLDRLPGIGDAVHRGLCSDSFFALFGPNTVSEKFETKAVRCSASCSLDSWTQRSGTETGTSFFGCRVYHTSSSVCGAAVHSGVLQLGEEGVVFVSRADGLPLYPSCNIGGLSSSMFDPGVVGNDAFYFPAADTSDPMDLVTLSPYRQISVPSASSPWQAYEADVTWTIAGQSRTEQVRVGPVSEPGQLVALNFCSAEVDQVGRSNTCG